MGNKTIKKWVPFQVFLLLFLLLAFLCVSTLPAMGMPKSKSEEGGLLRSQIQSLNLLNSLNLSREQMEKLLPVIKESKKARENLKKSIEKQEPEFNKNLKEMKEQLLDSNDVAKDLKKKFQASKKEIINEIKAYETEMKSLASKAKGILNENQIVLVGEYKPCLIPIRSISNPERIGQADGGEKLGKLMEKIRKIPDDRYSKVREKILARTDEKLKKKIKDDQKRASFVKKLGEAMDKVRLMTDEDYEMKKDKLFKGLETVEEKAKTMSKKSKKRKRKKSKEEKYIGRFLLNPDIIPILEYKIKKAGSK
ncbi:MAG: hypothetical protein K8T10_18400 [Candidatus Eremiobacteraeota bacterium]|nr:hypothetical protein [Candidatus Eremiobacteraeota bacterium]